MEPGGARWSPRRQWTGAEHGRAGVLIADIVKLRGGVSKAVGPVEAARRLALALPGDDASQVVGGEALGQAANPALYRGEGVV